MTIKDRIERLAMINGTSFIRNKAIEELSECIKAINSNIKYDIIDEIADVSVMIKQLVYDLGLHTKVDERINYKVSRAEKRLGIAE